ncbi:hypothetical protein Mevan_1659 [Methanococcus vannielii SB]|uniref:Uncharacterized protein n=1 Tax=Methanococcus vannielii (strain ATCC 35089 / DSM 1224 / JCM 13029 / OCM 148 / SB) TaxID=406327 RepID=A6USS9_METVS|nr:hypothetical protein [Methanococcus vannielii]ABR55551.1 hypothetical protein Mevan_1659 [Methanococcus vannielii SB]
MNDEEIKVRILRYMHENQKKNVFTFKLGDVFKEFKNIPKRNIVKNIQYLVDKELICKNGEFKEVCYKGICDYDTSLELQIIEKGINIFQDKKESLLEKIVKKFKKVNLITTKNQ